MWRIQRSGKVKKIGSVKLFRNSEHKKRYGGLSDGRKNLYERRIQETDCRIAGKRNTGGDVRWRRIRNWKLSG
ncbi:hypothetical protein FAEUMB_14380 [Faecalimonas umbilicata]|uniref:Uncharacterized protein n=1 Tax=Faecalimonas umbilicata TaxID=1912855 RepID=A0ABQ0QSX9_9FIRM|nr:hypothetical protein FAEUMB_00370 [Faecalimonas umbilicata]GBU04542.1 hypothetical protein FAEUMB_10830 [Faecalimonas umbilicata]GBU04897.1 hypothetical protein FAEUMB_14380 [Faecalimonas umbilicata]